MDSKTEFFEPLKKLIDSWCERRALKPLSRVLSPYLAFNGMTDGWSELLDALKWVRAFCRDDLPTDETATVADLIRAAEGAIYR